MCICLLCFLMIAICTSNAYALSIDPPEPRRIELGDGYVFHTTPASYEAEGYPKSGLYLHGALIYAMDIEAFWSTPYFSNDAMSLLMMPAWGFTGEQTSIMFYQQGIYMHRYSVKNLLTDGGDSLLPYIDFIGPDWEHYESRYYDRGNNILRITTIEDLEITFDLSTGLITDAPAQLSVSVLKPGENYEPAPDDDINIGMVIMFVVIAFALCGVGVWWSLRHPDKKSNEK